MSKTTELTELWDRLNYLAKSLHTLRGQLEHEMLKDGPIPEAKTTKADKYKVGDILLWQNNNYITMFIVDQVKEDRLIDDEGRIFMIPTSLILTPTEEAIKAYLLNEADRRGLVPGACYSWETGDRADHIRILSTPYSYQSGNLYADDHVIWRSFDNKWAKVSERVKHCPTHEALQAERKLNPDHCMMAMTCTHRSCLVGSLLSRRGWTCSLDTRFAIKPEHLSYETFECILEEYYIHRKDSMLVSVPEIVKNFLHKKGLLDKSIIINKH